MVVVVAVMAQAPLPASAAEISGLVTRSGVPASHIPIMLVQRRVMGLEVFGTVETHGDGRYTFRSVPAGDYFVASATPDGGNRYQPGNLPCVFVDRCAIRPSGDAVAIAATTTVVMVDLELDASVSANGRVISAENGVPIVGALVQADGGTRATRTDADGRYRLSGFNPGRIGLRATAQGRIGQIHPSIAFDQLLPRTDVRDTVLVAGENAGLDFALPLGARLRGSVRSSLSGAEIPDVVLYRASGGQSTVRLPVTPCSANTGAFAGGCFDIDGLFPGSYTLAAATGATTNYVATYWLDVPCGPIGCFPGGGTPIVVEAGQTVSGLHLLVPPRRWVTGVVRDALGGPPLSGATVLGVRSPAPGFGTYAEVDRGLTDSSGRYVLDDVPAGAIDVIVSEAADRLGIRWPAEDCTTTNRFCTTGSDLLRISMPNEGGVEDINLTPGPGAAISGTVRSAGERPVAGALVILSWSFMDSSASRTTRTDAAGRYRFASLPPGTAFHLGAQHPSRQGTVFHPDQWCISAPCLPLSGTPVVTPGIGTVEADLQFPAEILLRNGFEPAPP